MKKTIITLTLLLCATLSFAQELKVKSFTHDQMSLEARVGGGRNDLNGKQCALIKVQVRDDIVDCTGGNVGEIISKGIVKKVFVSPDTKFLKFEFKYNYPLKVTFADYGIKSLAEGGTYTLTLVDAYMLLQPSSQQDNTQTVVPDVQQPQPTLPSQSVVQSESNSNVLPITVNGISFNMIKVDGGTFTMGATSEQQNPAKDEKPAHKVALSPYYIGETEVTQALWKAVMGNTVREQRDKANTSWFLYGEGDNYPMYYVSWDECQEFIRKLNEITNMRFCLPTEAEWEFAARGGNKSNHMQYSGSGNIDDVAWYYGNSGKKAHPVKTKKANELGIYDMSGNVWEWCQDWKDTYGKKAQTNPKGPHRGVRRVLRGGSWCFGVSSCRSSNRDGNSSGVRDGNLGFRLALSE